MMKCVLTKFFLGASLMLTTCFTAGSQTIYRAGMAEVSLEPGTDIFSVSLAGYGYPRGGRFSLGWRLAEVMPFTFKARKLSHRWDPLVKAGRFPKGMLNVVEYKDRLIALTDANELYRLDYSGLNSDWVLFAKTNLLWDGIEIVDIAVVKDRLYGLSKEGRALKAVHHSEGDLSVRAVAISDKDQTVVLVGADLCGFNMDFIASIKRELQKKFGLKPEAVLLNASHTHFAPSTQDWTTWGSHQLPDTAYLKGVVRPAVLKSVALAMKSRKPAVLSFGRGKTAIGHNRSLTGKDAPYDNDLDVLSIAAVKGNEKKLVFLTGCHPVFRNEGAEGFTLSANYPGAARRALEQDGHLQTMFLQGCAGDINPVSADHEETGKQLAEDVRRILSQDLLKLDGTINFHMDSVGFAVEPWSREKIEAFRKENDQDTKDVNLEKNVRWADLMLKRAAANKMQKEMPVYVQTINIGNWKLLGLSREVTTSYSLGIKALWPDKLVSVAGYCNDVSSYLPTSAHIRAGTYEGAGSFFWFGQPAVFPMDVYEQIIKHIKEVNF